MALRWNKKLLLVQLETTVGTRAAAWAASHAVLATAVEITPAQGETVNRELERAFYGGQPDVLVNARAQISFAVELASSGFAPTSAAPNANGSQDPGWGVLARACGMSVARAARPAEVSASKSDYASGSTVREAEGSSKDYRVYKANANNANGNAFGADKLFGGDDGTAGSAARWDRVHNPAGSVYAPVSGSESSVSIAINVDGVQQELLGCRGTFTLTLGPGGIPRLAFTFTGKYADPAAVAALVNPNTARFRKAVIPSNAKTPRLEVLGEAGWALSELSMDWGAEVVQDERIGVAPVAEIVNRNTTGQLTLDARAIATGTNLVKRAKEGDTGSFWLQHGTADGDIVEIFAPDIQLGSPTYQDRQGTFQIQTNFAALPVLGNDELYITAR